MTLEKFNEDEDLKIAFEMLTLDILDVYKVQRTNLTNVYYPMLLGTDLRNHLAHTNLLYENLPNIASIFFTAKYFMNKTINANTALKIHNKVNFETRYEESLEVVETQRAMYIACKHGSVEDVKKCIQEGADINGKNCFGLSALDFAVEGDNIKVFEYLENISTIPIHLENIERVYEVCMNNNSQWILEFLLKRHKNNVQYLHKATCKNSTFMIKELISNGIDVNVRGINNLSALHIAVLLSHSDIVDILLENNADIALKDDRGNTALHVAALMGYNQFIKKLRRSRSGEDIIISRNHLERTPLHAASSNGHLAVVRTFIGLGADKCAKDKSGKTPFHLAAEFGREDVVMFLIEQSADIRAITKNQQSAMHLSARNGHLEILKCLFKKNPEDVKSRDYEGNTAFHLAIQHNREEIVEYLLNEGASVNHCNNYGQYPIDLAFFNDNGYICNLLDSKVFSIENSERYIETARYCSATADVKNNLSIDKIISIVHSMSEEYVINDQMELLPYLDEYERKLLLLNASFHGHSHSIIAICNVGIRFTYTDIQEALQLAALKGQIEAFTVLFVTYIDYNYKLSHDNDEHVELLYYAAINGNDNIIKYLIGKGIDSNTKDCTGRTALYKTIECGSIQGIKVLLENIDNIDVKDENGDSLLHCAMMNYRQDNLEIIKVLIEYGADVKAVNKKIESVLCLAVRSRCCLQTIKLLIDNGANEDNSLFDQYGYDLHIIEFIRKGNIADKNGKSALHYAAENNRICTYKDVINVFQFLIDNGVKCNAKDVDHKTALHYAAQHEYNLEKIQFLISNDADINAIDRMGKSALHYAAQYEDNLEVITFLTDHHADLNCIDKDGKSVSHYAACCDDNSDVLKYLSENGANFRVTDTEGKSALRYVKVKFDAIRILTDNGFNGFAEDIDLKFLLYSVIQYKRNLKEVEFLVDNGVIHSEISNNLDDTPISKINLILIQLLNGGFVDLNEKDENGNTILLCAIREEYELDIIKLLVNKGAYCNATNNKGKSTLHYSLKKEDCFEEIKFLIEKGANCNAEDYKGRCVLHKAIQILYNMTYNKYDEYSYQEISSDNDDSYFFPTYKWTKKHFRKANVDNHMLYNVIKYNYYLNIIQLLICNDAKVNVKDTNGKSFLHSAVGWRNNLAMVKLLIENGAIVNAIDNNGRTPLHYAVVCQNNLDIVMFLIDNDADYNSIDNFGRSVLHYVVHPRYNFYGDFVPEELWWNLNIIKFLVNRGEDFKARDHDGKSVFHYIVASGFADFLRLPLPRRVLKIKQIIELLFVNADLNAIDNDERTPLHYAVISIQNLEIIKFLIEKGADCKAKDKNGKSVLYYAAESELDFEIVMILIDKVDDLKETHTDGKSLLHFAVSHRNNLAMVKSLIRKGANLNAIDNNRRTPLHYAVACQNNSNIVRFLIEIGADCKAKDKDGKSVLHLAAESGLDFEAVEDLMNHVDDYLKETDNDGKSLLHYAAGQRLNLHLINYLYDNGADFTVEDQFGKAAWQYATEFEYLFNHLYSRTPINLKTKLIPK